MKHWCPRRQQCQIWQKSASPTFWPRPTPRGMWCQWSCEEPIDERTVQVSLLYHHPNFKYCTFLVIGTELGADRRIDGRTEDLITRCPRQTFQAGDIKIILRGKRDHSSIIKWFTILTLCSTSGDWTLGESLKASLWKSTHSGTTYRRKLIISMLCTRARGTTKLYSLLVRKSANLEL